MKAPPLAISLFLGVLGVFVSAAPTTKRDDCPWAVVERLVFQTTLDEFHQHRNARDPPGCIWENDGCTWAPESPEGLANLGMACQRHDFAYRNAKRLNLFTDENKDKFDDKQTDDFWALCQGSTNPMRCLGYGGAYTLGAWLFG